MRSGFTPLSLEPPQSQLVLHTLFSAPLLLSYTLRERERGRRGERERKDGREGEERVSCQIIFIVSGANLFNQQLFAHINTLQRKRRGENHTEGTVTQPTLTHYRGRGEVKITQRELSHIGELQPHWHLAESGNSRVYLLLAGCKAVLQLRDTLCTYM